MPEFEVINPGGDEPGRYTFSPAVRRSEIDRARRKTLPVLTAP
jgi:hypothetical protein